MPEDDPALPQFSAFLAAHQRGALDDELTAILAEVAQAVRVHGKPGKLTLSFKLEPNAGRASVLMTAEVVAKVPEADRPTAMFYVDDAGALSRDDPMQDRIPGLRLDDTPAPGRTLED